MDLLQVEEHARRSLKDLNNHVKRAALEARLCREMLELCGARSPVEIRHRAVDVIESLLMLSQYEGVRPTQLKDELVFRCEQYLKGGDHDLH